jgi:DNA-binding GntR family transcriptional regulator
MIEAARKTHTELYAAIAAKNSKGAAELMRRHLEEFAARAARYYATTNGSYTGTVANS